VKLLFDYFSIRDRNPPTLQTKYDSNAAVYVASRGKNDNTKCQITPTLIWTFSIHTNQLS